MAATARGGTSAMARAGRPACRGLALAIESGDLSGHFLRANIATLQSMLIKKAAFEAAGGFDLRLRNNEDWDFNIRLSRQGPIGFGEPPLLVVFDSPDGISKNRRSSIASQVRIFSKLRRMEATRSGGGAGGADRPRGRCRAAAAALRPAARGAALSRLGHGGRAPVGRHAPALCDDLDAAGLWLAYAHPPAIGPAMTAACEHDA